MHEDLAVIGVMHTKLTQRGKDMSFRVILTGWWGWLTVSLLCRRLHTTEIRHDV